jgi:hypothetical protein
MVRLTLAFAVVLALAGCTSAPAPTPRIVYVTAAPTPIVVQVTPAPLPTAAPASQLAAVSTSAPACAVTWLYTAPSWMTNLVGVLATGQDVPTGTPIDSFAITPCQKAMWLAGSAVDCHVQATVCFGINDTPHGRYDRGLTTASAPPIVAQTPTEAAASCTGSDNRVPGRIAFGTGLDLSSLALTCVTASFPSGSSWAWRADFTEPVTPGNVQVLIARTYNDGATEQTVYTELEVVATPNTNLFGAQADPGFLARLGPGTYMMEVLAGTAPLANGTFNVTP